MNRTRWKRALLQAAKIAVGSSAAIYVAELLSLEFAASAGSIALLTLMTTKRETLKLSLLRVITFALAVELGWAALTLLKSEWVAYGAYVFVVIVICELLGWKETVSVNAVIGTHFLMTGDFGRAFILNEFLLVLIGITVAILLNLFQNNESHKKVIMENMRSVEQRLQMILGEVAAYLSNREMQRDVWGDLKELEVCLHGYISDAYEYQNNNLKAHAAYYADYFEMRQKQCAILHTLHYEMKKIRQMPKQAAVIAEYVLYMADYVVERNVPDPQLRELERIFESMRHEPMPETRAEFESRALLYHILMDLEEFLTYKRWFVEGLDEKQKLQYWE